jgi:hypothetical protein
MPMLGQADDELHCRRAWGRTIIYRGTAEGDSPAPPSCKQWHKNVRGQEGSKRSRVEVGIALSAVVGRVAVQAG